MKPYLLPIIIALFSVFSVKGYAQVDKQDSLVLIDLYNSTDGANWTQKWDLSQPVNTWYGIGILQNKVVSININGNNLVGTIPASIGQLDKLFSLQLLENNLTGTIPSSLSNLEQMQYLDLYTNQLTGSIPSLAKMSLLQELNLSGNQLSGSIPEFGNAGIINTVDLSNNQLTGTIPSSLTALNNLYLLRLNNNQLSGSIPPAVAQMKNLLGLQLSYNNFSGTIPAAFNSASFVSVLMLDSNKLSGVIPASLAAMPNLSLLFLNSNKLTGSIPEELGKAINLSDLNLSDNTFSGGIPASFGNLTNLVFFWASNAGLSDTIPASLGNLSLLQELHLDNNQMSGRIPASLGRATKLSRLTVSHNKLSDTIPSSLGNLPSLGLLNLDHNQLTGAIPSVLGESLPLFGQYYFNDNQLSGYVPVHLGHFDQYAWLNTGFPPPAVFLQSNRFLFSDLEGLSTVFNKVYNTLLSIPEYSTQLPTLEYTPQATVPLAHAANTLSISVGSTVNRDTFRLYRNGALVSTQINDSVFSVDASGNYFVTVTNALVTQPSIQGQNLVLHSDTVSLSFDTSILPAKPAVVYANREFTGSDGWTNYYYDNNTPNNINDDTLLLSLQKGRQNIGTIGDGTFSVKLEATAAAGSNTGIQLTNPLITNPSGFWVMNRYWQVTPTKQPTAGIGVRFYYNAQDLADVNGSYPTHDLTNNKLIFYKSIGGNPDPTTNLSGATRIIGILPGAYASDTTWTYHQLSDTSQYAEFTVASFSGGGGGGTGNGEALPVQLFSFTAAQTGATNTLQWTTGSETNSNYFAIERGTNGSSFTTIGTVAARGNTSSSNSYSFVDNAPPSGTVYYRLRMVDNNGSLTYSNIRRLERAILFTAAIYPNPVGDKLSIRFTSEQSRQVTIIVTSADGKRLLAKKLTIPEGTSVQTIQFASAVHGLYYLSCTSGSTTIKITFIK